MPSSLPKALHVSQITELIHRPGILLIDIRSRRLYRHGHLPGSQSIPSGLLLAGEVPDGDLVLIGFNSKHSAAVVEELHELGYTRRISYLDGGFASWQQTTKGESQFSSYDWFHDARHVIGGSALMLVGGLTQSLGLLGLGLVLLMGPWVIIRSRA